MFLISHRDIVRLLEGVPFGGKVYYKTYIKFQKSYCIPAVNTIKIMIGTSLGIYQKTDY